MARAAPTGIALPDADSGHPRRTQVERHPGAARRARLDLQPPAQVFAQPCDHVQADARSIAAAVAAACHARVDDAVLLWPHAVAGVLDHHPPAAPTRDRTRASAAFLA